MRRTILSMIGLIVSTGLLVGLKTPVLGHPVDAVAGAPLDPAGAAGATAGPPGSGPAASGRPGGTTAHPTTTPGPPGSTPRPGQTTPVPGHSTTTSAGGSGGGGGGGTTTTAGSTSGTFTGAYVAVITAQSPTTKSSPCGDCHNYSISVTITVSSGRITKTSVSYNTSPSQSQSWADSANNQLSSAILSAQTWNLGRVSGATYAGNAWELSVRDAMNKAGLPT